MARPSDYTAEMADTICERLAGGESLRSICAEEGMPSQSMVFRWLGQNEAFREQYAHAREAQADALFDDILEISDDGRNDWMARLGEKDAGWAVNGEHIQRSRLRVDARKWMASKLAPKKYGDKLAIGGDDAAGPVRMEIAWSGLSESKFPMHLAPSSPDTMPDENDLP